MSTLPDHASPTQIASVGDPLVGQKLLLAGRMMCYDSATGFILLLDNEHALLVDVNLCLDRAANSWVQNTFCSIQVIGHLEKSASELPIPSLPPHANVPEMDARFIVRAIRVIPSFDIDQNLFNDLAEQVRRHAETELQPYRAKRISRSRIDRPEETSS